MDPLMAMTSFLREWHVFKNVTGLTTSFPKALKKTLKVDSSQVALEDAMCETIWTLMSNVLTERCSSAMYLSEAYPCALAGILSPDKETAETTLRRFQKDWECYCAARKSCIVVVRDMCKRSTLNTRGMEGLARLAKRGDWEVTEELKYRINSIFSGIGTEDILEDSLGKVRDAEYRDQQSKVLKMFKAYEILVVAEQLANWGRTEVNVRADCPSFSGDATVKVDEEIFKPRVRDEMNMKNVQSQGANHDWQTFNPTSLQPVHIEAAFMRWVADTKGGNMLVAEDIWRSSILPLHSFLLLRGDDGTNHKVIYSLKVSQYGVLGWPVVRRADRTVKLQDKGAKLEFYFCTGFDDVFVAEHTVMSPLHNFLRDAPCADLNIMAKWADDPVPALEYQARRGFLGVPESSMQKLAKDLNVERLDEPLVDGLPLDMHLTSECIATVLPDLTEPQFQQAMRSRVCDATRLGDNGLNDFLDGDELVEILDASEHKAMKKYQERTDAAKQVRTDCLAYIDPLVTKKYDADQDKKKRKVAKKVAAPWLTEKGANRWWASVKGDMEFINAHRPVGVGNVVQDDDNGRFLTYYPKRRRVSVSWTKRGIPEACVIVLKQLWDWHFAATGQQCPHPL